MPNRFFLDSNQVSVYPSGYREASIDVEASRTTEGSIAKAISAPVSSKSYARMDGNGILTVVIEGYVFTIPDAVNVLTGLVTDATGTKGTGNIYAYIARKPYGVADAQGNDLKMLVNANAMDATMDANGKFMGIGFAGAYAEEPCLLVLSRNNDTLGWEVPEASMLNISASQVAGADGKSIESVLSTKKLNCDSIVAGKIVSSGGMDATGDVFLRSLSGGATEDHVLVIGKDGKVSSKSTSTSWTRTPDSATSTSVATIGKLEQDSLGRVTVTEANLPMAGAQNAGLVSTADQVFKGNKTFNGNVTVNQLMSSGTVVSNAGTLVETPTLIGTSSRAVSDKKGNPITGYVRKVEGGTYKNLIAVRDGDDKNIGIVTIDNVDHAQKLTNNKYEDLNVGNATKPVYFLKGVPVACSQPIPYTFYKGSIGSLVYLTSTGSTDSVKCWKSSHTYTLQDNLYIKNVTLTGSKTNTNLVELLDISFSIATSDNSDFNLGTGYGWLRINWEDFIGQATGNVLNLSDGMIFYGRQASIQVSTPTIASRNAGTQDYWVVMDNTTTASGLNLYIGFVGGTNTISQIDVRVVGTLLADHF